MRLVVYTARFGETDALRPPCVINPDVEYLCFSDAPCAVTPYQWIPMPSSETPRLAARQIKVLADHPALADAEVTLWHDASYQLTADPSWVRTVLAHAEVAALAHPRRVQIEQEALAIARYGYVSVYQARAYVARYRAAGFTDDVLTASGLLARRQTATTRRFAAIWWKEVRRWNGRDQASINYAAWRAGLRIHHLSGLIRHNAYAIWRSPDEEAAS